MSKDFAPTDVRPEIEALTAYAPGLSIEEIRARYGCERIVKMASNENALGASPMVQERLRRAADTVFRYPQGGNPRLVQALAQKHGVDADRIVVSNGSDEIIDLLMRVRAIPGQDNVVCFKPCFGMYSVQAQICGLELRQAPLNEDFSMPFEALLSLVDKHTKLVFVTTPDNPSGFCPDAIAMVHLAKSLPQTCLLVIDEAYMDFTDEAKFSLLAQGHHLDNIVFLRTFSKSYGLAGIRLGYGIMPTALAQYIWRARMPFSVNILAEEAGLAALEDTVFYQKSLEMTHAGRKQLHVGLEKLGCTVWPSHANFLMFAPPKGKEAALLFEELLRKGFIIRALKSYSLPHLCRISIGTEQENTDFLQSFAEVLEA